ncbi:MAG: 2,3-epoxybenzoyl-CoA dihydrolase [Myxococcota bacterium]
MIDFNRHPESYKHWTLTFDGPVATLALEVDSEHPYGEGYDLKLNSYDLGVDMELCDAVQRVRFEHPEVQSVIVTSGTDRVFCAGANIGMLGGSSHPFKVNFCKYTNETRLSIEDASRHSGIKWLAAVNGACAGGGYELALACDEIYLINDNNSTVSLPEVPLLGVLPGTGGLTRMVDKRKIRRDHADVFSTLAEGLRGKRAKAWNLIDDTWPKSKFNDQVQARALQVVKDQGPKQGADGAAGFALEPINHQPTENGFRYENVEVALDAEARVATVTVHGPKGKQPSSPEEFAAAGSSTWAVRAMRELDDAVCQLRFGFEEVGLIVLHTRGAAGELLQLEKDLVANKEHWLCNEILLLWARVCRRWDLNARSMFYLADRESCTAGVFLELAMACDRIYLIDDPDSPVTTSVGPLSDGLLPMSNGLTRLQNRFLATPEQGAKLAKEQPALDPAAADEAGLCTFLVEDLDWDDDVRIAIEERASLSPDALTGMEASLRFAGAETCDSKIFGRLSAWQNWIFIRPNATGAEGALTRYGAPESARFDWRRT